MMTKTINATVSAIGELVVDEEEGGYATPRIGIANDTGDIGL